MGNCFVLTADEEEIVAVMDGQCGVQRGDLAAEERRRAALVTFIGADMPSPPSLAVHQWLAGEVRLWGNQGERCRLGDWEHGADLRSREGPKCHLARSEGL